MNRLWIPALVLTVASMAGQTAERRVIYGIAHKVNGTKFELETRAGKTVPVDAAPAMKAEKSVTVREGLAVSAEGTTDKKGVLQAEVVNRVKSARAMWPEDR
ncbi:MAG TPA: hypothetical protein VKR61_19180 [Bryobacteraceae bacterium]|nr:hypothetical protein [Bryobacteraceae bacterium]